MKVIKRKKNCFRDFHYSGSKFKVTGYKLLNKIYEQEIIPESMLTANLTKIFQMHGDLNSLKNYRFIPGRGWMSKLFEKCLVCIVNEEIDKWNTENQIGGLMGHGTRVHIITVTSVIKKNSFKGEFTIVTLLDVSSCFDKCQAKDNIFDLCYD